MNYTLDFTPVIDGLPNLLLGCLGTFLLAICGMVLAVVIGIGGVALRDSRFKPVRWLVIGFRRSSSATRRSWCRSSSSIFALPLVGVRLDPTPTAIIALGINGGAYAIEIIRGGVQSIQKGQIEAGLALGLHKAQVFRLIVLKPALRAIYPVADQPVHPADADDEHRSAISAYELTSVAQRIESESFRSFEVYFTVTFFYLADLVADDAHLRADLRALLHLSGQVRDDVDGHRRIRVSPAWPEMDRLRCRRSASSAACMSGLGVALARTCGHPAAGAGHGGLYRACSRARRC